MSLFSNSLSPFSQNKDDDESNDDMRKIYIFLFFIAGMLISAYYSWTEFRYKFFSHVCDGSVVSVDEVVKLSGGRRNRNKNYTVLNVTYTFNYKGQAKNGSQVFPIESNYKTGDLLKIQFLDVESDETSRVKGTGNALPVIIFFALIGFLVAGYFWIANQMNAPIKKSSERINRYNTDKRKFGSNKY